MENNSDCNDNDSSIHPGATEIKGDGIDQDCDGEDAASISSGAIIILTAGVPNTTISSGSTSTIYGSQGSNHITLQPGAKAEVMHLPGNNIITIQCDSSLFSVSRSGSYVTFEGSDRTYLKMPATASLQTVHFNNISLELIINNDNQVLLGQQIVTNSVIGINVNEPTQIYYRDNDNDGYGDPNSSYEATTQPSGYVSNNNDCNDDDASVHPGATEIAGDGIDQNCDGFDPPVYHTYYLDSDGDGYGDSNSSYKATSQPPGYVSNNSDCDDNDASIHPGATEIPDDGVDQNCDGVDLSVSPSECGAYIAPGVWKEFDCYNLAAIGKTTGDDPFTPSWRLIGGYWQWGRKGPDSSQWYDTNTANFAHGPTGPDAADANDGEIIGWDTSYAPNGAWSDSYKTANDPCLSGYRVLTRTQWEGVVENNTQYTVGTWSFDATNYSSGRFFGDDLMLPAAGYRRVDTGAFYNRGLNGTYWSSSGIASDSAGYLTLYSSRAYASGRSRRIGQSVRCIVDNESTQIYYRDNDNDGYGDPNFSYESTSQPSGYVSNNSDCNDDDASIHPGATEIAGDGIDQNCDGIDPPLSECGAYIAPGVWKEFDCYNLAAIGKTTGDDPFTPSWRLIGGYWQWGRKGTDKSEWYDTNSPNFIHGPTGLDLADANGDEIDGRDTSYADGDAWSDSEKTTNDPCPSGYRVPTRSQWDGVCENNQQSTVGAWLFDATNYSSGHFFGDDLMLPTAGYRGTHTGLLYDRGYTGRYWSSNEYPEYTNTNAIYLFFNGSNAELHYNYRIKGYSVRCVADDGTEPIGDLSFVLTWTYDSSDNDDGPDLDLHVIDPSGQDWNYSNAIDHSNPNLDFDDQGASGDDPEDDGEGPERMYWETPDTGTYKYYIQWFENNSNATQASYTIKVYKDDTLYVTKSGSFSNLPDDGTNSSEYELDF